MSTNIFELYRKEAMLERKDIAKKTGFSGQYIHLIETGKHKPSIKFIKAFCKALKLDTNLFKGQL